MLDLSFDLCRFMLEAKNAEKHNILDTFSWNYARKLKPKMASWWRLQVAYVEIQIGMLGHAGGQKVLKNTVF